MSLTLAEKSFINEHIGRTGMKEMALLFTIAHFVNRTPQDVHSLLEANKDLINEYVGKELK